MHVLFCQKLPATQTPLGIALRTTGLNQHAERTNKVPRGFPGVQFFAGQCNCFRCRSRGGTLRCTAGVGWLSCVSRACSTCWFCRASVAVVLFGGRGWGRGWKVLWCLCSGDVRVGKHQRLSSCVLAVACPPERASGGRGSACANR